MTVHTKTRRRVRVLVVVLLVLCVGGTAAYVVRKRQIAQRVLRDRDAGYAALEAGDYFNALHKIGPYVQRHPAEVEALARYALARRNVEEPNGRHLADAISLYRRVLERAPDHAEAREQLMEIYLATGFNTEILTSTEGRTDPTSLRARAIGQGNLGRDADARKTAEQYLAARPEDLRMQMFLVSRMQRLNVPGEQIVEHAGKVAAARPDDPRSDLLVAFAHGVGDDRAQALKHTLAATAKPIGDPEDVQIAVDMLDSLDREDEALALLSRAADVAKDKQSQRRVIARLYQSRQYDLVDRQVAALAEADPKLHADLLAHRAMALQALGRRDEAAKIVAGLADRKNDFAAAGWAKVLAVLPAEGAAADDRAIIEACREGLRGEADNPYFRLYLGDAYARLGEADMSTLEWARAAQGARVWAEPLARLMRLMIVSAQPEAVRAAAARLQRLAPEDPRTLSVVAAAEARLTNRKDPAEVAELTRLFDRVQQLSPGEPSTLQLKVGLLALTDRGDDARRLINESLAPGRALPAASYAALAQASEAYGLGLEQAVFDRGRAAHAGSFEVTTAEAAWLVRHGRAADAVKLFESARAASPDKDGVAWRLAWAQLLEEANDDRAAAQWAELADALPDNAAVQRAALGSRSAQANRDLQRRVIDRLKAVVGETGVGWRLAEARWTLAGLAGLSGEQDRQRELVKATSLVNDIVQQYPDQLEARLLLADCLLRLEKRDEAITHLTAAARLAPGAFGPAVQLAALLQANGDFDRAKPFLEQAERVLERSGASAAPRGGDGAGGENADAVANADMTRDAAWELVSRLYAQRGDTARAVEILQRVGKAGSGGDGAGAKDAELMMAELLARRGELSDEACRRLMESPTLAKVEVVAEQYARSGRSSDAEATLARLESVEAKPGERELVRGLYLNRRQQFTRAIPELEKATAALPASEPAWRGLLQALIMEGRGADAAAAANRAAAAVPANAAFKRLAENGQLVGETAATPRLRPMLAGLLDDTGDADRLVAVLRIVRDATAGNKTIGEVLAAVRPIAERSPRLAPVQYLMTDLYQATGNLDEALAIANRLTQLLPTDPQPAQRAVELYAAGNRWAELVPVAQEWRKRLGAVTLPADEMLAAAYVATEQYEVALRQLSPYADLATTKPSDWARHLTLRAQALVGLRRISEAEALLFPLLADNPPVRQAVARIAVVSLRDPAVAVRWLDQAQAAVPADSIDERLVLAQAWRDLATRPGQESLRPRTEVLLKEASDLLAAKPDAAADPWVVLGMLKEQSGDAAGAQAAYRAALRVAPEQNVARNNLAMLLIRDQKGVEEALALATAAAKDDRDPGHAEYLDTLAQVQSKAGKLAEAEQSMRKAVQLAPQNLMMQANLVQVLVESKKFKDARQSLEALERQAAPARAGDPQLDARLKSLAAALASAPPQ